MASAIIRSCDRHTGEYFGKHVESSTATDVDLMARAADRAFRSFSQSSNDERARLLREIADGIEGLGDELIDCTTRETALARSRLLGERTRTCNQLRMFADLAASDLWREQCVEPADSLRLPLPRPDVRSRRIPIGPVAVFSASNFPLAFSVAGGDTASALCVGCPVLVKAHPAHPGTSILVANVVREVVRRVGLPDGVFNVIFDKGHEAGVTLVRHPAIQAVAFTGSREGGLSLWRVTNQREQPIPCFAEMGSINPAFVFPSQAIDAVARQLQASMVLGVGQFCTQPGVLFLRSCADTEEFIDVFADGVRRTPPATMLTDGMQNAYQAGLDLRTKIPGVQVLARSLAIMEDGAAPSVLFAVNAEEFLHTSLLREEIFGPASVIVRCSEPADFLRCARLLDGQLTASIWANGRELAEQDKLLWTLEAKVGRMVLNDVPTGVEVVSTMVHGGPFPATMDSRFTSVGARAVDRFVRAVAYQGWSREARWRA